jgi:hypothetical protein
MRKRDLIIQIVTAAIVCTFLSIAFASFEYSSQGSEYVKINFRDTILYLFCFIGLAIPSVIIGLFIRLNEGLMAWFRKKYWVNITCCLIGIGLSFYSLEDSNIVVYEYRMDGMDFEYWHPRYSLQVSGWFIIIFSVLNLYLPDKKSLITGNEQMHENNAI